MSREARGAVLVVALFGLGLLALVLRRRLDDGGAPAPAVEAVERAAPAPLAGAAGEQTVVASPAHEQPPGPPPTPEGPPPPAPAQGAPGSALTLRGRVVDAAGRPVSGARVVFGEGLHPEVTSAGDGSFVCEGIRPGELGPRHARVDLQVSDATARAVRQGVVVGPDQPPVEVVLRPTTRLRVKVLSSGASVRLRGVLHADGLRPRTEQAEGELDLECHEGDWVDVVALAPGHAPRRVALRAPSPEVIVRLSRAGAGALRGRVVQHDGAPARRVHLQVHSGVSAADAPGPTTAGAVEERPVGRISGEGRTRDDGSFMVDGLAEGTKVQVVVTRELLAPPGRPLDATVGDEELLITLPRPGAHRVRLRAVAAESGQPLPEPVVGPPWGLRGDASGVVTVDLPGPGEHELPLLASTRLARRLKVTLDREETRDLGDVPLDLPGTLLLTLRWPEAPVDAVWLTWMDPRGEPGRYDQLLLRGVRSDPAVVSCAPGSRGFTLRARRPGGQRQVVAFEAIITAGQTTPVEVDLTSAPVLERE